LPRLAWDTNGWAYQRSNSAQISWRNPSSEFTDGNCLGLSESSIADTIASKNEMTYDGG
jgi:hypothetical protein